MRVLHRGFSTLIYILSFRTKNPRCAKKGENDGSEIIVFVRTCERPSYSGNWKPKEKEEMKRKLRKISALLSLPPKSKAEKRWNFFHFFLFFHIFRETHAGRVEWLTLVGCCYPPPLFSNEGSTWVILLYSALFFFCSVFLAVHLFFRKVSLVTFAYLGLLDWLVLGDYICLGGAGGIFMGVGAKKEVNFPLTLLEARNRISWAKPPPSPLEWRGRKWGRGGVVPRRRKRFLWVPQRRQAKKKLFFWSGVAKTWIHKSFKNRSCKRYFLLNSTFAIVGIIIYSS